MSSSKAARPLSASRNVSGFSKGRSAVRMTRLLAALALIPLSGCSIAAVDYGDIRHADYVADPRCTPQPGAAVDGEALPYFFAPKIGRASGRERVVQYGLISVVAV